LQQVSEINPDIAKAAAFETDVAASLMLDMRPRSLSPLLIGDTLAKLPFRAVEAMPANDTDNEAVILPKSLRDVLGGQSLQDLPWKSIIPGIAVHNVLGNRKTRNEDRLYLFRAKGGMQMPEHSHEGEEWTLTLTGSYMADEIRYSRGDLHIADDTVDHAPRAEEGEDCICLVVTQGPLVMKGLLPKLIQQVVGV